MPICTSIYLNGWIPVYPATYLLKVDGCLTTCLHIYLSFGSEWDAYISIYLNGYQSIYPLSLGNRWMLLWTLTFLLRWMDTCISSYLLIEGESMPGLLLFISTYFLEIDGFLHIYLEIDGCLSAHLPVYPNGWIPVYLATYLLKANGCMTTCLRL